MCWRYLHRGIIYWEENLLFTQTNKALKYLLEQREVGTEYQRWVSKLMGFDFEIQYRSGISNKAADALSREYPGPVELCAMVSSGGPKWADIQPLIQRDCFIQQVKDDLLAGKSVPKGYQVEHGILKFKGRVVLPKDSLLINSLLQDYHDSPMGGHSGDLKTYQRLATSWFWPGMRKQIALYVSACPVCQQSKTSNLSPAGLLQPLPIPSQVWEDISMDFVEGLPKSKGMDSILIVVDRLSKYAHFIPLKHPFTVSTVATIFIKKIVKLHGFPSTIVSDRDKIFMSLFWRELFAAQGTKLCHSTAYHPRSDGHTTPGRMGRRRW